ncbi:Regulatory protein LuxR (fragment) [Syntrophaceticus schinkii]|uniref:Regulatory protein LuxR n=2 Tax=Syntrophaceticus schinkii TaxID=499207 RepID=A0A0B7MHF1_9FIRM
MSPPDMNKPFFSLQLAKSSGAFFVLDATVNPALDDAQSSRVGLYLKNMEPNIVNSLSPNIIVLRGFPSISRANSLPLHAQWKMEFETNNVNAPYYHRPIDAANLNPELPLSRLYYWSPAFKLPGTSEDIMLCSVPLIDSRGHVFGVCGLEISAMLFKLSNMPQRGTYQRMFCVFSPITENKIDLQKSMFAGGYSAKMTSKGNTTLKISDQGRSFCSYKQSQGRNHSFLGFHKPINLYSRNSTFSDEKWVAALMIPEMDVVSSITRLNLMLISLLTILVLLGIIAAFFLSKQFLKPFFEGLDIIKSENLSEAPRTQIPEINDLIDFLKVHNEELYEKAKQENLSLSSLDEFLENTEKLTPSERLVFNHYVKGYTPKETAEELFLSINTIKTHNKRIYTKLNINSRDELILYVKLLKEIGKEIADQGDQ